MLNVFVPMVIVFGSFSLASICVFTVWAALSISAIVTVVVLGSFIGMLSLVHALTVTVVGNVPLELYIVNIRVNRYTCDWYPIFPGPISP